MGIKLRGGEFDIKIEIMYLYQKGGGFMKDKTIAISVSVMYVISLVTCFVLQYFKLASFEVVGIVLFLTGIIYLVLMFQFKGDVEAKKNRSIIIFYGITKLLFLFGSTFENKLFSEEAINLPDDPIIYVAFIIGLVLGITDMIIFYKNKSSKYIKYYVMIGYLLVFLLGVTNIDSFWVLMMAIPVLTSYNQFEDIKLMFICGIGVNIINFVGCSYQMYFSSHKDMTDNYTKWIYTIEILFVFLYTAILIHTTFLVKKFSQDKRIIVKNEQDKIENIMNKVIDLGREIKTNAFDTNNLVNELDGSIKKSLDALNEISDGNVRNVESVENQTEMTAKITNLISGVQNEVKKASESTSQSLNGVDKSRKSFEELKHRSTVIAKNNKEVINVMDEFVNNAKIVKKITSGIADISEQTNLLSLNASIESVRAGDVGKGFAVVANQIRSLADETSKLTDSINKTVGELEENAVIAQKVVKNVVDSITEENNIIDGTMDDFKVIEQNIYNLSNNVEKISYSVENVAEFNRKIESHISQLTASSEEVTACTEEAVTLYKDNKKKTYNTRKYMDEMLETANKLDEFYYIKENMM